jgi:hypothetical protein
VGVRGGEEKPADRVRQGLHEHGLALDVPAGHNAEPSVRAARRGEPDQVRPFAVAPEDMRGFGVELHGQWFYTFGPNSPEHISKCVA